MKKLKPKLNINNIFVTNKHNICKGDGIDNCGYDTKIECEECKYGGGRKNPESKCNSN